MSSEELIRTVYAERGTLFPSATPKERQAVHERFRNESAKVLDMLEAENGIRVPETAKSATKAVPVPTLKPERTVIKADASFNSPTGQRQVTVDTLSAPIDQRRRSRTAMVAAFKHDPAQAARLYPELTDAHNVLETVRAKTGPQSRNKAVAMMHRELVKRIDQGKPIPTPRQAMRMVGNAIEGYGR